MVLVGHCQCFDLKPRILSGFGGSLSMTFDPRPSFFLWFWWIIVHDLGYNCNQIQQQDTATLQPVTIPDTTHSVTGYNQIQLQPDTVATGYIATGYSCHRNGFFCNRIQATRCTKTEFSATGYKQPDTIATGYNCNRIQIHA